MSEKDLVIELLTITEIKENGEVVFTDRSIEIIKELGEKYEKTPLYRKSRAENPDWEGEANAGLLFVYMCERITGQENLPGVSANTHNPTFKGPYTEVGRLYLKPKGQPKTG